MVSIGIFSFNIQMVDGTKEIFKDFLGNHVETTELQVPSGETVTLQNMPKRKGHGKL